MISQNFSSSFMKKHLIFTNMYFVTENCTGKKCRFLEVIYEQVVVTLFCDVCAREPLSAHLYCRCSLFQHNLQMECAHFLISSYPNSAQQLALQYMLRLFCQKFVPSHQSSLSWTCFPLRPLFPTWFCLTTQVSSVVQWFSLLHLGFT